MKVDLISVMFAVRYIEQRRREFNTQMRSLRAMGVRKKVPILGSNYHHFCERLIERVDRSDRQRVLDAFFNFISTQRELPIGEKVVRSASLGYTLAYEVSPGKPTPIDDEGTTFLISLKTVMKNDKIL